MSALTFEDQYPWTDADRASEIGAAVADAKAAADAAFPGPDSVDHGMHYSVIFEPVGFERRSMPFENFRTWEEAAAFFDNLRHVKYIALWRVFPHRPPKEGGIFDVLRQARFPAPAQQDGQ